MMMAAAYIFAAIMGGALAQLFMKAGLRTVSTNDFQALAFSLRAHPEQTAYIILGISLYAISMIVWVFALKHYNLSKAYPLLSLSYVVVYVFATVWPGVQESFSTQKSIGIALIVFGVWYSQRSSVQG